MLRREPHKLKYGVVHNYSYKPRRWSMKSVKDDPFNYHLGVELETDSYFTNPNRYAPSTPWYDRQTTVNSDVSGEMAADMRRPKNLWTAKTDSSVTGPEFVSHPATLTYWQKHKPQLKEMFEMLLHAGYRSHDNDKCGMHINISRNAFDGAEHLYRFMTLLHYSPAWSMRMSQRTRESALHWAPLEGSMSRAKYRKDKCRQTFDAMRPWYRTTDKYSALNMPPAEEGRFEFRLPRGTLRVDRFLKNLEWTVAMIEYTRTSQVATSRPIPFMTYVMENKASTQTLRSSSWSVVLS